MRPLLFDHPLLDGYAEHLNVAGQWFADVAVRAGLTIEQAQGALDWYMFAADTEIDACQPSTQARTSTSKSGSTASGSNTPTAPS